MTKIKSRYIVFLVAFIFYLILPNQDQGFDSYSYALDIRNGVELFHPHHLLYNFIGHILFSVFEFTRLGSLELLSIFNSLLAAIVISLIFSILQKRLSALMAIIGAATVATLYSFWYYATSLEVNMAAILFLMLALYFVLLKPPTRYNSILIFLFLGIGILFHQIVILAIVPILIYEISRYHSVKKPFVFALPGIILVALIYVIVGLSQISEKTIGGFYNWLTFYSHLGVWGKVQPGNFVTSLWGLSKAFFGGEILREIVYGHKHSLIQILYAIMAIAFIIVFMIVVIRALRPGFHREKAAGWLLLSLIAIFGLFAFRWAPTDDGFWLYAAIILIMFVFYMGKENVRSGLLILGLLFILNIPFEIIPATARGNSIVLQGTESLRRQNIDNNDLVLTNLIQIRLALDYYYGLKVKTANLVYSEAGDSKQVAGEIHQQIELALKTGKVFAFENELNPEPHRRYLFDKFSPQDYLNIYKPYYPSLMVIDSLNAYGKLVRIYRITDLRPTR